MTLSEYKLVPITALRSSNPALSASHIKRLEKKDFTRIFDLLTLVPKQYEDRSSLSRLADARGEVAKAVRVQIISHDYVGWRTSRTLKIYLSDEETTAVLLCYGRNFLARQLPIGSDIYLWAKFSYYKEEWSASSFDFEPVCPHTKRFFRIVPRYSLVGGLSAVLMQKSVDSSLAYATPHIENDIPEKMLHRHTLLSVPEALQELHQPSSFAQALRARNSLAYRELFYTQLQIGLSQYKLSIEKPPIHDLSSQEKLISTLKFSLTEDQKKVLKEISDDLRTTSPMFRILQGDVGCGKTLVAFLSALAVQARRQQSAFIAPTALLARQHFETARTLLAPLPVSVDILHGTLTAQARRNALQCLKDGSTDIIIGTHALLSESVEFANLGFVIIDEQQRFGVTQRSKLTTDHQAHPDVLIMTATPIPRTLTLSLFGHSDLSTIHLMPPGRKKIHTHLAQMGKEEKVYAFVEAQLQEGFQAYFVCPRIEEDELHQSTETVTKILLHRFKDYNIAVLHSRIDEHDTFRIMQDFQAGNISIIVATSVVEVGIDVARATCMVIMHAELFGLSTLHQLRGRVGRSTYQSHAFLVYAETLSEVAKERLKAMYESNDGFELAERDLFIRGPGDIGGIKQSGYLKFEVADLRKDLKLLQESLKDSRDVLKEDAGLLMPQFEQLRKTLQIESSAKELQI